MYEICEVRNYDGSLVGKTHQLENGRTVMLEVAKRDCATQFIWPAGVEMKVINKKRFDIGMEDRYGWKV